MKKTIGKKVTISENLMVFICDECDGIHMATYDQDDHFIGQVIVHRDELNTLIIELMKLRDTHAG